MKQKMNYIRVLTLQSFVFVNTTIVCIYLYFPDFQPLSANSLNFHLFYWFLSTNSTSILYFQPMQPRYDQQICESPHNIIHNNQGQLSNPNKVGSSPQINMNYPYTMNSLNPNIGDPYYLGGGYGYMRGYGHGYGLCMGTSPPIPNLSYSEEGQCRVMTTCILSVFFLLLFFAFGGLYIYNVVSLKHFNTLNGISIGGFFCSLLGFGIVRYMHIRQHQKYLGQALTKQTGQQQKQQQQN